MRAGAIIRNLRDFVEKRESEREPEDPQCAVVEEGGLALAFAGAADPAVKTTLALSPALPLVLIGLRIQIQQVFDKSHTQRDRSHARLAKARAGDCDEF